MVRDLHQVRVLTIVGAIEWRRLEEIEAPLSSSEANQNTKPPQQKSQKTSSLPVSNPRIPSQQNAKGKVKKAKVRAPSDLRSPPVASRQLNQAGYEVHYRPVSYSIRITVTHDRTGWWVGSVTSLSFWPVFTNFFLF